jgi:hypothetical protein
MAGLNLLAAVIIYWNTKQAHSKLGCDKSPILLKSKENGHGPHRAGFA